jgi:hypothetical protein
VRYPNRSKLEVGGIGCVEDSIGGSGCRQRRLAGEMKKIRNNKSAGPNMTNER